VDVHFVDAVEAGEGVEGGFFEIGPGGDEGFVGGLLVPFVEPDCAGEAKEDCLVYR
jgi:hypothetical protein